MPGMVSQMHLDMLRTESSDKLYGLQWGDPDQERNLALVRDYFLRPHVTADTTVLEIGPGGGRWTRYMLDAKSVIVVDPFQEILDVLAQSIPSDKITAIRNTGTDFPGVTPGSIDFLFSFGVFVHLDPDVIQDYLVSMRPLLHAGSLVFIQYADKTKLRGFKQKGFAATNPAMIRDLLDAAGYSIVSENTTILPHSCMVLFRLKDEGDVYSPTGVLPVLPGELYPRRG